MTVAPSNLNNLIIVSPHFDDAVFSCGGLMAHLAGNVAISVINIFTLQPTEPYSRLARAIHRDADYTGPMMSQRAAEDRISLSQFGATSRQLGFLDAIYRRHADSSFVYSSREQMQGGVILDKSGITTELTVALSECFREISSGFILAPLGVGGHVDHVLARLCSRSAFLSLPASNISFAYYEDFPYASDLSAVAPCAGNLTSRLLWMHQNYYDAKLRAGSMYASQIRPLWGCRENYETSLREYSTSIGNGSLAERYWLQPDDNSSYIPCILVEA